MLIDSDKTLKGGQLCVYERNPGRKSAVSVKLIIVGKNNFVILSFFL